MNVLQSLTEILRRPPLIGQCVLTLALGVAIWGAWLGWDHSYYYDPDVGALQGPYRPAQVVACAATVGVVTMLLASLWQPVVVAAGISLGFWASWTIYARSEDDSGLYLIGSALLMVGLVLGTAIAAGLGYGARRWVRRTRERQYPSSSSRRVP